MLPTPFTLAGITPELSVNTITRGTGYQTRTTDKNDAYTPPEIWRKETPVKQGSWWPTWQAWLPECSSAQKRSPPTMGSRKYKPICDAPGT